MRAIRQSDQIAIQAPVRYTNTPVRLDQRSVARLGELDALIAVLGLGIAQPGTTGAVPHDHTQRPVRMQRLRDGRVSRHIVRNPLDEQIAGLGLYESGAVKKQVHHVRRLITQVFGEHPEKLRQLLSAYPRTLQRLVDETFKCHLHATPVAG